jgi:hypothetical protein
VIKKIPVSAQTMPEMTNEAVTNSPRPEINAIAIRPAAVIIIRIAATEYLFNSFTFMHHLPGIPVAFLRLSSGYYHISLVLQKLFLCSCDEQRGNDGCWR